MDALDVERLIRDRHPRYLQVQVCRGGDAAVYVSEKVG